MSASRGMLGIALGAWLGIQSASAGEVLEREARDTLTAVELDRGDTLKFRLKNGQVRTLVLEETAARVIYTNLAKLKVAKPDGCTIYQFTAKVTVDGHPITLERYVGSQESFYEPYVINGMRLWFDAVIEIFDLVTENHGPCKPGKHARFAVQDAADRICPPEVKAWYPNAANFIDIRDCYNGDDCWMGPYQGADAHGGLDVRMPKNTPNFCPLDVSDHFLFNSLHAGQNNNRWRGLTRWPNGDVWGLQNHHILTLLVPEHEPIRAGDRYALGAGVHVGDHTHAHFGFQVHPGGSKSGIWLDPWIIFWQSFEDAKARAGAIRAEMAPLGPARTGEPVTFRAGGSRRGPNGGELSYTWVFGDGGWSDRPDPTHTFAAPGVYPVTLTVDDGAERATQTQHLTVEGAATGRPSLVLSAPDEPSFRIRPVSAMDVYGMPVSPPRTLSFLARASRPVPKPRTILVRNIGERTLPSQVTTKIRYQNGSDWLLVESSGQGNDQMLTVTANGKTLRHGLYAATVTVESPGADNPVQGFRVELTVPTYPPGYPGGPSARREKVVDDADAGFTATPYFWVGHRNAKVKDRGFRDFYLTNGGRPAPGEFARFTPDLAAGRYQVVLHEATPFPADSRFAARVVHKGGETTVWVEPAQSRDLGTFSFEDGMDGYVELLTDGSRGAVLADAVVFRRIEPAGGAKK